MHSLLARQLKRAHNLERLDITGFSKEWQAFVAMVEQAYTGGDADRALAQRSIEIASEELVERNQQLLLKNGRLQGAEQELRKSRDELEQRVADRTAELRDAKDVSERIKEHFQLLLNSTGEGIYGIGNSGLCTFANVAAAKLLGYTVEQMIGQHMHDLIHYKRLDGSPYPVSECPIYRSARLAQSCRVSEDVFWTLSGTPIAVEYSSFPLRDGERCIGAVIAFSDISARKQVETELRQAKELAERASQTKSEFLARMSHEIRTPLNGVIGMIDSLVYTDLTVDQKRYTTLARSAAESLIAVINDILDFSKIEAGKVELECVDLDFPQLVEDLVELFGPVAAKKQLVLTRNISTGISRRLRGDSTRIRQVLTNLISNAIKFTSSGSVDIRLVPEPKEQEESVVRVEIADTGIGIPTDRMDRLFQSFSQVDTSITRHFGGTGLGLAICKRLVELMGGQIGVHSESGVGTTFWFTLPLAATVICSEPGAGECETGQATVTAVASGDGNAISGMHLLVAEDNEMNQFVTQEVLKRAGCTCDIAADGALTVEAFKRRQYSAILMDCQMPNVDGLEATRQIRQIEMSQGKSSRIPIIALTADAISGDRERCLAAGMDGYVTKPINPKELYAEIRLQTNPSSEAAIRLAS